ncbi:alpha/beta fold hydrolase [Kitasatospora hibisci]|uniref:alpha/beta fold hydrolase n=1 Tax=Kitasatospora hibisci TaxID=3369522 RepID=UPI003754CE3A
MTTTEEPDIAAAARPPAIAADGQLPAARDRPFPALPGVTHRFVTARGVRFHVAEAGSGEPVLLLHGFPQHWYAWRRVIPELAEGYRLICLDLRGCGWTDAPRGGYDSEGLAGDVLAVLDALGLDRVHLIGHETGGWLGFRLCLAAPGRFSRFLAVNAAHPWPRRRFGLPLYAWRYWYTAFWEYPGIGRRVLRHWPGFTRFLLRHWAARPDAWDEAALEEFVQAVRPAERARAGEQLLWQFVLHDIPALARGRYRGQRLRVPTLMLCGEQDPVTRPGPPAGGERHADDLAVRWVPGGHLLPEEAPGAVAAAARRHFGNPLGGGS